MTLAKERRSKTEEINFWKALGIHFAITVTLFAIFCFWFKTPHIADDHRFLFYSKLEGFSLEKMGYFLSRAPVFTTILYWILKLDYLQTNFYFLFILFFSFHSLAVFLTTVSVIEILNKTLLSLSNFFWYLLPATIVLAFYPNFFELLLMPSSAVYAVGALAMALAARTKNLLLLLFLGFLAFASYETFILPLFALTISPVFFPQYQPEKLKRVITRSMVLVASFLLFYTLRTYLAGIVGEPPLFISTEISQNFVRLMEYCMYLSLPIPLTYWKIETYTLLLIQLIVYFRHETKISVQIVLFFVIFVFTGIIDLVVPYPGLRVIYGSYFLKIGLVCYLFALLFSDSKNVRSIAISGLAVLAIIYTSFFVFMQKIRHEDYSDQARLQKLILRANEPDSQVKTVLLPLNNVDFNPHDWGIEPNSVILPMIVAQTHGIQNPANYFFVNFDTTLIDTTGYPVLIPPKAFVNCQQRILEDDSSSFTGQIFRVLKNQEPFDAIWGPNIAMQPGNYRLELSMKVEETNRDLEIGSLEIGEETDSVKIATFQLQSRDFATNDFKKKEYEFSVSEPGKKVEFRLKSSGKQTLFINFILVRYLGMEPKKQEVIMP